MRESRILESLLKDKKSLLQEQQTYLDKKLDKRDQDLMQLIRDTQETKKLIAATQQKNGGSFGKNNELLIK